MAGIFKTTKAATVFMGIMLAIALASPAAAFAATDNGSLTAGDIAAANSKSLAENAWVKKPRIKNAVYGSKLKPSAKAKYGTPVFTYSSSKNGVFKAKAPKKIGIWYMKATVKKTGAYGQLTSSPVKFRIVPKGTALSKVQAGSQQVKVSWKKRSIPCQIQYSTNKSFKKAKSVNVKKGIKSKAIKKLVAGKRYYVRIRTYKVVSGKKIYSAWSKPKSAKPFYSSKGDVLIRKGDGQKTADLYVTSDWALDYIKQPKSAKRQITIGAVRLDKKPVFSVLSGDSVTVDKKGRVKPASTVWYWYEGFGTTAEPEDMTGVTVEKRYNYGTSVVGVKVGAKTYKVKVTVKNYEDKYAEDAMNSFIKKNIKTSMTQREKLETIVKYTAEQYDYSPYYSGATGMIVSGGGDCWASTDLICALAEKVGLKARSHSANWEFGAGSGHYNAQVLADGDIYECEAGYSGDKPRSYNIEKYTNGFKYYVTDGKAYLQQYTTFGKPEKVTIPRTLDGYEVAGITRSIFQDVASDDVPIKEIVVPATVTELDDRAFYTGAGTLEKVSIASDNPAFVSAGGAVYSKDYKKLYCIPPAISGNFAINENTVEIAEYAGAYTTNLKRVTGGDNLESVGEGAFWNSGLTSIALPKTVKSIGAGAFLHCDKCTVVVNSKDATIERRAFGGVKLVKGYVGSTAATAAKEQGAKFEAITLAA